jgi:hypothetical protein
VTANGSTAPGTYTYAVQAENSGKTAISTLTVTVQSGTVTPPPTGTGKIVISEFRFRGPSGGNDEFIELYNAGTTEVDLNGWKIQNFDGTTFVNRYSFNTSVKIPAKGFYLLKNGVTTNGYSLSVAADADYGTTGIGDNRAVRVVDAAAAVQDLVGFANSAPNCEGTCLTNGPTSGVAVQISWARNVVDGQIVDTGDNASDFTYRSTGGANPQNSTMTFTGSN